MLSIRLNIRYPGKGILLHDVAGVHPAGDGGVLSGSNDGASKLGRPGQDRVHNDCNAKSALVTLHQIILEVSTLHVTLHVTLPT